MGGQHDLPAASNVEQTCDAATEIKNRRQELLRWNFDSDVVGFQAYLDRVNRFNALPYRPVQQWVVDDPDEEGGPNEKDRAFAELVDTYPLAPELLRDNDGVYRRSMVHFCCELLKAEAELETGLTEKAWWHLSRVCFYEGQAQGYYLGAKPTEDKKRSGKNGGIAKEANKQQTARDACIKHLKGDRPLGGWISPDSAIRAVAPKVEAMIRKQREEVDVHKLLYAWLNGDLEVQRAGGFTLQCTKV